MILKGYLFWALLLAANSASLGLDCARLWIGWAAWDGTRWAFVLAYWPWYGLVLASGGMIVLAWRRLDGLR